MKNYTAEELAEYDRKIGSRLREARLDSGMSRTKAADILGVTHQQFEKYEKGMNRISARTIFILSDVFNKPIDWFAEDMNIISRTQPKEQKKNHHFILTANSMLKDIDDKRLRKMVLKVIRFFYELNISNNKRSRKYKDNYMDIGITS